MMRRSRRSCATSESLKCGSIEEHCSGFDGGEHDKEKTRKEKNPATDLIGRSGHILSRATLSSKITRKWQDSFWVHLLPTTIVVFRSEENFQEWRAKERLSRKALLTIDFDSVGTVSSTNSTWQTKQSPKVPATKLVSRVQKYSLGDIQATLRGGEALFTFRLERLSGVGVDVIASFASTTPSHLRSFRQVLHNCIRTAMPGKSRLKGSSKLKKKGVEPESGEEDTHLSTIISTQVGSEMTRSTYQLSRGRYNGSISSASASYRPGAKHTKSKKKYYQLDPKLGVDLTSQVGSDLTCNTDQVRSGCYDSSMITERKPNIVQIKTSQKAKSSASKLKKADQERNIISTDTYDSKAESIDSRMNKDDPDRKINSTTMKAFPSLIGSEIACTSSTHTKDDAFPCARVDDDDIPIANIYITNSEENEENEGCPDRNCDDKVQMVDDVGNLYPDFDEDAKDIEIVIHSKMGKIQIDLPELENNDDR